MLIDFHTHTFPDKLAPRALSSLSDKSGGLVPVTDGTMADTALKMREWGVNCRVMLSIATNPHQQKNVNDFAIANNTPDVIAFGSVHPDAPDAIDELGRLKAAGLKGVKLHPEYQAFDIDDRRMYPIYDCCQQLGFVVSFHTGKDLGFPDTLHAPPAAIARMMRDFPHLKAVMAHMGGCFLWSEALDYVAGLPCYIDTSFTSGYLDKNLMEQLIDKHGAQRVLFGSDCPWASSKETFDFVDSLNISDEKKEQIFYQNAKSLLGL